eukprot:TRINITY_DN2174_c0_g4_i3.p1 TRINITY_DN2174_c0_g4~~TRINITY_DN2174_c0_g4_i3.p1  ORF type:complete len:350 (-),score=88.70 TRINITY_DN2174_c0_g4_i3:717-1766(-)
MVVLAASITTKQGKVLVSRQFVDITQARIESLLSAFPKLRESLGDGTKQHTLIETTSVRYLYQKIEELYLVVITSKSSNIVEDLATLQILSRVVPEYCGAPVTDKSVIHNGFELVFAFDEVVALGYRENVSKMEQLRTFTNMDSGEEVAYERQQKNQEREAKEVLKRKMKEIERERKERERMGLPAFSGPSSKSPGYGGGGGGGGYGSDYSNNSVSQSSYVSNVSSGGMSSSNLYNQSKETEKKVRKGLVLGKKETSSNIMDQLKKEGEITNESSKSAVVSVEPIVEVEQPIMIEVQEQMKCLFDRDGTNPTIDITGYLAVTVTHEDAIRAQISVQTLDEIQFRVFPWN